MKIKTVAASIPKKIRKILSFNEIRNFFLNIFFPFSKIMLSLIIIEERKKFDNKEAGKRGGQFLERSGQFCNQKKREQKSPLFGQNRKFRYWHGEDTIASSEKQRNAQGKARKLV